MPSTFQLYRFRKYYQGVSPLFKNQQIQGYTMIVLSFFTIAFFGLFAIKPTLKTITVLHRQISDKTTLNEKLDQKINSLILAQDEYQNIQKDLPLIYSLLPPDPQFPLLFRKLELLAAENGAAISSIQFNPFNLYEQTTSVTPVVSDQTTGGESTKALLTSTQEKTVVVPEKQTQSLTYAMSFSAPYQNLIKLLNQLTKLDRLATIVSVQLSVNSEASTSSKLNISINANSYYLPLNL